MKMEADVTYEQLIHARHARLRRAPTLLLVHLLLPAAASVRDRRQALGNNLPGSAQDPAGGGSKRRAFLFPPKDPLCFHSSSFKTHPSRPAALALAHPGPPLEHTHSCSRRGVGQTRVDFPASGPLLFWLKSDPLKWIPGHQNTNLKKSVLQERGQNWVEIFQDHIPLSALLNSPSQNPILRYPQPRPERQTT